MTAAAKAQKHNTAKSSSYGQLPVYTALVQYYRARVALFGNDYATAGARGFVGPWTSAKGETPLGWAVPNADSVTGVAAGTAFTPVDLDAQIVRGIAVTGASSAAVATARPVYASDDATFTLTRPANPTKQVGFVLRWYTGTTCDVYFYSAAEMALSTDQFEVLLASIEFGASVDGDVVTDRVWRNGHCKITALYGIATTAPTGAAGTCTFNMEIGSTNLTGGVVTFATGDARGALKAGTAVTGANEIHDGDTYSIEQAASGGTRTTGQMDLWAVCEKQPGN